jgi:pantetheine-phosphate adenylyltransferase
MNRAVFAGSFDPPTWGHLDIIQRAAQVFDGVDVVIAENAAKSYWLSADKRQELLEELCVNEAKVRVVQWSGLIINYLKEENLSILIRGVRNAQDMSAELTLAAANHSLYNKCETLFIPTKAEWSHISSSLVREGWKHKAELNSFVPDLVGEYLAELYED